MIQHRQLLRPLGLSIGLLIVVSQVSLNVARSQSVDDLDNEFDALDARLEQQFNQQDQVLEKRFLQVKNAIDRAYKGLSKKISVNWHEDVVLPEAQSWTTYDDTFTSRATFDFKQGVYKVETIVDGDVAKSLLQLQAFATKIAESAEPELQQVDVFQQQLQQELSQSDISQINLLQPNITNEPYVDVEQILAADTAKIIQALSLDKIVTANNIESQPVLPSPKPQSVKFADDSQAIPASENIFVEENINQPSQLNNVSSTLSEGLRVNIKSDLAKSIGSIDKSTLVISQPKISRQPSLALSSKSSVKRLSLTIPYINNYQKNLLEGKLDTVKTLAKKYKLDVSLILAVIETESSFNPMAMSPIPAFGLMQLVPNTAGLDAYEYLYGEKQIVSPAYLFDQNNNLLLGTTYLHILSKRYLRGIKNPQSKLYCMLASYNTGVGNMAKTFTGKKSIHLAVQKINNLQAQQTYELLMKNLPAIETKNYLRKILARKQQYTHFDQS